MLIDWFTVGAQALNFLILVWLMKRFLYRPVLAALDAREKLIAAQLADAAATRATALADRDQLQHKNELFDRQRAALLKTAADAAKAEGGRLLEAARQAADAQGAKRREAFLVESANLHQAISRRTQDEVFAIARKALADLATTSLEERMAEVFTRRLRQLDGQPKIELAKALHAASEPVVVRSAFELPPEPRAAIQKALDETFAAPIGVQFVAAPELVSGIELSVNGQQVAWSIADYLLELEKDVGLLLRPGNAPQQPKAGSKAAEPVLAAAAV